MRTVVIGNSGSGKTTLARGLSRGGEVPVLDLDTVAWVVPAGPAPVRRAAGEVRGDLERFCRGVREWVVEGCYGELAACALEIAGSDGLGRAELVWLNPGEETCVRNCRGRAWEAHKYASRAEQDANLEMLIGWVRGYAVRDDDCSLRAHRELFARYDGPKREVIAFTP